MRAKVEVLVRMALLLCAFQALRWGFESLVYLALPHTLLTNELVRTVAYVVLFGALMVLARKKGVELNLLPARLSGGYVLALGAFALLFVATPLLTGQANGAAAWAALMCGCLATPLFEETLFRGYVWDRLERAFGTGWKCLVVSAVLFGLWHLGYADAVAWRVAQPDALGSAALWVQLGAKTVFATGIGLVLGLLRMRHGNCLAPGIFHGMWNLLA